MKVFLIATQQFGLRSRVRSDQGGENILVAQHMLKHRGEGSGGMTTRGSTHNQRIEHLWGESCTGGWCNYSIVFFFLGLLDPLYDAHLYTFHYVYLTRITHAFHDFFRNHHSIRSEGRHSPHQLFVWGSLILQISSLLCWGRTSWWRFYSEYLLSQIHVITDPGFYLIINKVL